MWGLTTSSLGSHKIFSRGVPRTRSWGPKTYSSEFHELFSGVPECHDPAVVDNAVHMSYLPEERRGDETAQQAVHEHDEADSLPSYLHREHLGEEWIMTNTRTSFTIFFEGKCRSLVVSGRPIMLGLFDLPLFWKPTNDHDLSSKI